MSGLRFLRCVLGLAAAAMCQVNYSAWTKSGAITIGTTPAWANYTGGAVANFPLLVHLDSSVFKFSDAKAGGADIRFSSAAGTDSLPYEIEAWDAAKGSASIWVKVPSVTGNATQTIKMYWGNTAATAASNGAGVFGDFTGVWHLSDAATSTTNKDASGHGGDGTKMLDSGNVVSAATIKVVPSPLGTGQAYNQTKTKDKTVVPQGKILLKNKSISVSAWIKRDSLEGGDFFVAQGTQDPTIGMRLGFDYNNSFTFSFDGGVSEGSKDPYTKSYEFFDWHYWVGTFDLTTKKMSVYKDGVLEVDSIRTTAYQGIDSALTFGWAYGPSGDYYHPQGSLDEVRVATTVHTPDWIKLSYLNQKSSQALVSYPVPAGCTDTTVSVAQTTLTINEGDAMVLHGSAKCSQRFQWVRVDGTTETPLESQGTTYSASPRVSGTTVVKYRLKGLYNGVWKSKDVTVSITEKVPEPQFTLNVPAQFNDADNAVPLRVYPIISNLAAIKASVAPTLTYVWDTSYTGDVSLFKNQTSPDTLDLFITGTGTVTVKLCIDNGGPVICKQATTSASAAIRPIAKLDGSMLDLKGSMLSFKRDAVIRVWDMRGKVLYSHAGAKGERLALTPALADLFFSKNHVFKATPAASAGGQVGNK